MDLVLGVIFVFVRRHESLHFSSGRMFVGDLSIVCSLPAIWDEISLSIPKGLENKLCTAAGASMSGERQRLDKRRVLDQLVEGSSSLVRREVTQSLVFLVQKPKS